MPFAPGEQLVEKHWTELKVLSQSEVVESLLPNPVLLVAVAVAEQRQIEEMDGSLVEHLEGGKIRSRMGCGQMRKH